MIVADGFCYGCLRHNELRDGLCRRCRADDRLARTKYLVRLVLFGALICFGIWAGYRFGALHAEEPAMCVEE